MYYVRKNSRFYWNKIKRILDEYNNTEDGTKKDAFVQDKYKSLIASDPLNMLTALRDGTGILPSSKTVSF